MTVPIRVTFDRGGNAAHLYLRDIEVGGVARTVTAHKSPGVIDLDFDAHGRLIGIELLDATRLLPPELLQKAERV